MDSGLGVLTGTLKSTVSDQVIGVDVRHIIIM